MKASDDLTDLIDKLRKTASEYDTDADALQIEKDAAGVTGNTLPLLSLLLYTLYLHSSALHVILCLCFP